MTIRFATGLLLLGASLIPLQAAAQDTMQGNTPPVAAFDISTTGGEAPIYFTVDGSASSDADGKIVDYRWDFGDTVTGSGAVVGHGYIYPGDYTVTLTVTDDRGATASTTRTVNMVRDPEVAMFQLITNLVEQEPAEALALIDRARAAGANTVFFSDTKVTNYGLGQLDNTQWEQRATEVFQGIKDRDMDLVLNTINMGYCNTMLSTDPNLATGYPVTGQEMVARGGVLVPQTTSTGLIDGGFESATGNRFDGPTVQDKPGDLTFVDTEVWRSGKQSIRMEMREGERTRFATNFTLEPETQYTLKLWMKTEDLTGNGLEFLLRDIETRELRLQSQLYSVPFNPAKPAVRRYVSNPRGETSDWQQVKLGFNSGDFSGEAELYVAMYNGKSGRMWVDDLEIVNTPTLNWLVRDDLPVKVERADGTPLEFGRDVDPIVDPGMGQSAYQGNFDTYHVPPAVTLPDGSRVKEGDTVKLSGWTTMTAYGGQVGCSWNNDTIHKQILDVHRKLEDKFDPDGYLLNFDEIRHGGYEPGDTETFANSGRALSESINRAFASMESVTQDADYYFWSDMLDPFHNARDNYFHIKGSLDKVWEGTLEDEKDKVVMATWWQQPDIDAKGRDSLSFFSRLGYKQIVGAFYDAPSVRENYEVWQGEIAGVNGITGNMYATWTQDYSKIEDYGQLWWNGQ